MAIIHTRNGTTSHPYQEVPTGPRIPSAKRDPASPKHAYGAPDPFFSHFSWAPDLRSSGIQHTLTTGWL